MRFVVSTTLAGTLRGAHIAEHLGVPWSHEYKEPDEWVIFVKTFDGIDQAKADGCRVVLDPVDFYCYEDGRAKGVWPEVDLLLIPNKECAGSYRALFPNADFMVIPHQWDSRIEGEAEHDEFRPAYIGAKFNMPERLTIPMVTEKDEQLSALPRFNCHLSQRVWKDAAMRKPATKVASAAAVGAVVLTTPDASARHLLGEYPFYIKSTALDALHNARKAFGSQAWEEAREIMRGVKERTSMETVGKLYEVFR